MSLFDIIGRKKKARIFICYRRRGEGSGYGGRVADKLIKHFGQSKCFRDIENIETGVDFVQSIKEAVGVCEVLVVVIGPDWATQEDAHNRPRIKDPNDFVRLEVGTALQRNIRVIPVLVGGAQVPIEDVLPEDLEALSRRQAHELTDSRWEYDTDQLIRSIESIGIKGRSPAEQEAYDRRMKVGAAVVLTSIVLLLGVFLWIKFTTENKEMASQTSDQLPNTSIEKDGSADSVKAQLEAERKARLDAEQRSKEALAKLEQEQARIQALEDKEREQETRSQRSAPVERERIPTGLIGRVEVHWVLQGTHYVSILAMDGKYGIAYVTYTDQNLRKNTVKHNLELIAASPQYDFDYWLLGSNPINLSNPSSLYYADSFDLVDIGGNFTIIKTCSEIETDVICSDITSIYGVFQPVF